MIRHFTRRAVTHVLGASFLAVGIAAASLTTPALAQDKKPIKIGFGMALTGPLAANGKQALLGMKIWAEDINAKGGLIDGRPVELVYYDDQSNPSTVPGIYSKLLDVDKVDLILGGYATNQNAPAMPIAIRKKKAFISLFALGLNEKFKYPRYFSMLPTGPDPKPAFTDGFFQIAAAQNPKPKTIALVAADAEFAANACEGARKNAKKYGFKVVFDRSYPPATTDFAPIIRSIQAANPDLVVACSYPLDSVGLVLAANEADLKTKMFGGAMVGLQATVFKMKLKGQLNGLVNYEFWVPAKGMMYNGTEAFFKKYQSRAKAEGIDPLGYYLGGWGHAYISVLGDAVKAANSLDDGKIADVLHKNEFDTVMGKVKFGKNGEWEKARVLAVQYHGLNPNSNIDTFRGMSYQTVLEPSSLKTGNVEYPYTDAKNK